MSRKNRKPRKPRKPYIHYASKHLPACSGCVNALILTERYPEFLFVTSEGVCSVCDTSGADSQLHVSVKPAVENDGVLMYPLVDVYGGVLFP